MMGIGYRSADMDDPESCPWPHPPGVHITGCTVTAADIIPMNPYRQIVRELAARGPFIDDDQNGYGGQYCADCHIALSALGPHDPANHEPSCLWRRARDLYPQP